MTMFKFKNLWQCKSTMTVKSVGGIVLGEDACGLRKDHDGHHRGNKLGLIWDNHGKRIEMFEKLAEKPNKPLIFIGGP